MTEEEFEKAEAAFLAGLTDLSRKHGVILQSHDPFWVGCETSGVVDPTRGAQRVPINKGGRYVINDIGTRTESIEWEQEAQL